MDKNELKQDLQNKVNSLKGIGMDEFSDMDVEDIIRVHQLLHKVFKKSEGYLERDGICDLHFSIVNHIKDRDDIVHKSLDNPLDNRLSDDEEGKSTLSFSQDLVCELTEEAIVISGVALKEGTYKGTTFKGEHLKKGASTLRGCPVKINHIEGEVFGVVTNAWYDEMKRAVLFEARIENEYISSLLKDGSIKAVSVGVMFNRTEDNVAKDLEFVELSLTSEPACKSCVIY